MPRHARVHLVSLRSSLVNLPISIYGPLLERNIRPQHVAILLTSLAPSLKPDGSSSRVEAYVGWTGMLSSSSIAHFSAPSGADSALETVEIDPQYAQGLGLTQGDIVEIGLLHNLSTAKSIATEPLTPDDWEILELHADHVESTLLSQVRVAAVNQEIDVWVLGRTRIRLRVLSLDPSDASALLLTTDTEVYIAPKTRIPKATGKSVDIIKSSPLPEPHAVAKLPSFTALLRVMPASVLASSLPSPPDMTSTAYVSPQLLSIAQVDGKLPKVYDGELRATIQRLVPPVDPAEGAPQDMQPTVARILNPGEAVKREEERERRAKEKGTVRVCATEVVPEGQVVVSGGIDGVVEWDVVQMSIVIDHTASRDTSRYASPVPRRPPPPHALAGVDELLSKCRKFAAQTFALQAVGGVRGLSGLLVTGRSGAGKTSVLQATARTLQWDPSVHAFTYYVDLSRYTEKPVAVVRAQFQFWLDKAMWHRPSVLVFDNLDKLLPAELEHTDSFRSRHLTETFVSLFSAGTAHAFTPNTSGVVLLAGAESQATLHPLLSTIHLFKQMVHLKPPDKGARKEILAQVVQRRLNTADNLVFDANAPLNFVALATETEGYSATDLQDLVARAVHEAAVRSSKQGTVKQITMTMEDFKSAHVGFVPLSLRDVPLQKSTVEWADVGGLSETRRILRETLEWPTKYAAIFAQSPLRLRSGLLLYGYPGCGKTLLASAAAKECGLNFISIKGPELLNKYIGASEKSVRDIFERANAAKPCVLFFDEFDSIAPKRGHDSTGVTDRVVNQLLTLMDGAEGLDGVYVLAATSRPDLIDPALLRPGRLDKSLLCNMPTASERKEILRAHARKVPVSHSVDFDYLAAATEDFSGADLQALLYNAHLEVVHASMSNVSSLFPSESDGNDTMIEYTTFGGPSKIKIKSRAEEMAMQLRLRQLLASSRAPESQTSTVVPAHSMKHEITDAHLRKVLKSTRPSVAAEEVARLTRIYSAFMADRSGDLPVPPDGGGVGQRASLM
ncbi:AAA-domain-containing protein [Artomyces pyxidatus]|uniref:AAA-domain-containing protein n=1 Tax=Artomyces pyxidatus TaxID=48021 RepID=A0ACB8SXA9_9AGAM|nr:AAA-domain-containing protein [Artomyces pyxidatus]